MVRGIYVTFKIFSLFRVGFLTIGLFSIKALKAFMILILPSHYNI